jgi:homoserine O-acetyltransferase/O-succinyltransferase
MNPDTSDCSETTKKRQYLNTEIITLDSFTTGGGFTFSGIDIAYETYGKLNADRSNAILICHALTGSAHASDCTANGTNKVHPPSSFLELAAVGKGWWDEAIGPGKAFDTNRYFVVCSNFIGSCYGTTGPTSINPLTGKPFAASFPDVTVRDMVHLQKRLLDYLEIPVLKLVAGGSLGGMQALEWALLYPDFVESILPIATSMQHSAWAIGLNEAARLAIKNDPVWNGGNYKQQPEKGLGLARIIAMLSYRSYPSYQEKQGRTKVDESYQNKGLQLYNDSLPDFQMESYLRYQAEKITQRFDANTYITITRAMDSHDVARDRGPLAQVLEQITAKVFCVGIDSDLLYPDTEQREIASLIPGAQYKNIKSIHGHDAFLIEFEQMERIIREILES